VVVRKWRGGMWGGTSVPLVVATGVLALGGRLSVPTVARPAAGRLRLWLYSRQSASAQRGAPQALPAVHLREGARGGFGRNRGEKYPRRAGEDGTTAAKVMGDSLAAYGVTPSRILLRAFAVHLRQCSRRQC
jgi:hypothetical protein